MLRQVLKGKVYQAHSESAFQKTINNVWRREHEETARYVLSESRIGLELTGFKGAESKNI